MKKMLRELQVLPLQLKHALFSKAQASLRCLIYHNILPSELDKFEQQLDVLKESYQTVSAQEFTNMMDSEAENNNILLSFDDGFKSNRIIAEKLLSPRNISALFFIAVDFILCEEGNLKNYLQDNLKANISNTDTSLENMRPMTIADVKWLVANGHTIGAHTFSHARLNQITSDIELEREIIGSADRLEDLLNVPIRHFAYPFGDIHSVNSKVIAIAKKRYDYFFSGVRGNNIKVSPFAIRREHVALNNSLRYFKATLDGCLSGRYKQQRTTLDSMV